MTAILQWLITYAIVRAALSIGFGIVTYGAVIFALNQAIGYVKSAYNAMPLTVLQFLSIAGVPEVLGILTGAVIARATLQFAKKMTLQA